MFVTFTPRHERQNVGSTFGDVFMLARQYVTFLGSGCLINLLVVLGACNSLQCRARFLQLDSFPSSGRGAL